MRILHITLYINSFHSGFSARYILHLVASHSPSLHIFRFCADSDENGEREN